MIFLYCKSSMKVAAMQMARSLTRAGTKYLLDGVRVVIYVGEILCAVSVYLRPPKQKYSPCEVCRHKLNLNVALGKYDDIYYNLAGSPKK